MRPTGGRQEQRQDGKTEHDPTARFPAARADDDHCNAEQNKGDFHFVWLRGFEWINVGNSGGPASARAWCAGGAFAGHMTSTETSVAGPK